MFRNVFRAFLALLFIILAPPAFAAASGSTGFYLGADAVFDGAGINAGSIGRAPKALYGVNLYGGYEVLQGISVEAGYQGLFSAANLGSATEQGVHGDVFFRVPLTDWADLKAGGGVNYTASAATVTAFESINTYHSFNWGWHLSAGPELTVLPTVGWRTLLTYQQGGFGPFGTGDLIVSSGLAWHI